MASLEVYGSRHCPYTAELLEDLDWRGDDYRYFDVEEDDAALTRMLALTGQRTVPVLVEAGEVRAIGHRGRGCTV